MRKGISPIVAVVLLIAIAVIAAVGIYFWMSGLATKQPTPEKPIPIVANPVSTKPSRLAVLVANLGDRELPAGSEIKTTNGARATLAEPIPPGEQKLIVIYGGSTNTSEGSVNFTNNTDVCIYSSGTGTSCVKPPTPVKKAVHGGPIVITEVSQTGRPWTDSIYYQGSCRVLYQNGSNYDIYEIVAPECNFSHFTKTLVIPGSGDINNQSRPRYFLDGNKLLMIYRDPSTTEVKISEFSDGSWVQKSTVPLTCNNWDDSPSLSKLTNGSYIAICSHGTEITYSLSNDLSSWSTEKILVSNFRDYVYGNPGSSSLVHLSTGYFLIVPILHPVETVVYNDGFIIFKLDDNLNIVDTINDKAMAGGSGLRYVPSAPAVVNEDGVTAVTGAGKALIINSLTGSSWPVPPNILESNSEGFYSPSIAYDGNYYWMIYVQVTNSGANLAARFSNDPLIWE